MFGSWGRGWMVLPSSAVDSGSSRTFCNNLRYLAFSYPKTEEDEMVSVAMTLEKATEGSSKEVLHMVVEKIKLMN